MTDTIETQSQAPIPVTIWETIAIASGAVLLVVIGSVGLVYKFFSNAANPIRATMTAQSLMDYTIPGEAEGVFGANLGGAKVAIVSSPDFPKDPTLLTAANLATASGVELFIARVPLDVETANPDPASSSNPNATAPYDLFSSPDFSFSYRSGEEFQVTSTRTAEMKFCNSLVPVRIQAGQLLLNPQLPPVQAVKYDAIAIFDQSKRQVTVTALGQTAAKRSEAVFTSLKCK